MACNDNIKLKYNTLTDKQKESVTNGCGGKGGWFNPPEFIFHASCNQHDFYYWRGGCDLDRKKADDTFYKYMKKDTMYYNGFKKLKYKLIAYVYYKAVRLLGGKYFYYTYNSRTLKDIHE